MIQFILAGGIPAIVIVVVGTISLVTAIRFALAPDPTRLAVVRALNLALTWTIIVGVTSNLMKVAWTVAEDPEMSQKPLLPLLVGFAESLVPVVLGGAVLAVSWIAIGIGLRHLAGSNNS